MEYYDFYPEVKKLKGLAQIKWYLKHVDLDPCLREIETINKILTDFPADVFVGEHIRNLFKNLNISIHNMLIYENCTIVQL
jgi:hypothetical protein